MAITATLVKELREKTNAGMMDCKKALEETQGNFDAAIEWLRVKGLSAASKKAGRVAAEGLVYAESNGKVGVVVEINSETDFVARNDGFKEFVKNIAEHVTHSAPTTEILEQAYHKNPSQKVGDLLKETIAKIGENVVVRRAQKYEASTTSYVHTYIHGEGKIGVLLEVAAGTAAALATPEFKTFTQDVALHIAAMNPMALSADQVPAEVVSKEKEILKAKNLEQGKKAEMIDKIVDGQIRKFLAESCLVEQAFVKNPDLKVSDYAKETAKKVGTTVEIKKFVRFELGEGIEKKSTDFAAEVAAQVKGH
ncbi:MAG: translation elongation factor Ts [Bdellovibrionaceae bacterium]|nr:translation elongation factor Ts [Pseudobdellovibrionaceae bacterium]NUM58095.1 elongation factor Ts [Pseudobdellovibrionaceae bacterium]